MFGNAPKPEESDKPRFDIDKEAGDKMFAEQEIDATVDQIGPAEAPYAGKEGAAKIEGMIEEEVGRAFESLAADSAKGMVAALDKGDKAGLAAIKDAYLEQARSLNVDETKAARGLAAALAEYHSAYQDLGKKELASEIDSFRRSLESRSDVRTAAGQEYLRKLDADEFPDEASAMYAFEDVKKQAAGQEEELNAEFNLLLKAAQEHFAKKQQESASGEKLDIGDVSDKDMDDIFGGLTG